MTFYRTHGHAIPGKRSREYKAWAHMIQRCTNPNNKDFHNYGARGVLVCEQWFKFENFLADMGICPPNLTLERQNNDGNYELGNCIWTTRSAQTVNQRRPNRSKWGCGVYKQGGRWRAWITRDKITTYLGMYPSPEAARAAYAQSAALLS